MNTTARQGDMCGTPRHQGHAIGVNSPGIGTEGSSPGTILANAASHALLGCAAQSLTGGDCAGGAIGGAASALATPVIRDTICWLCARPYSSDSQPSRGYYVDVGGHGFPRKLRAIRHKWRVLIDRTVERQPVIGVFATATAARGRACTS